MATSCDLNAPRCTTEVLRVRRLHGSRGGVFIGHRPPRDPGDPPHIEIYIYIYLRRGDESQSLARIFLFPQRNVVVAAMIEVITPNVFLQSRMNRSPNHLQHLWKTSPCFATLRPPSSVSLLIPLQTILFRTPTDAAHFTLYTLHFTLYTPHFPLSTLHSIIHTLHSTLHTLHSSLHTLHFTHYTLHSTLFTLHSILYTLHFTLLTAHLTLHTPHFTLHTLHFTLYTLHSTLYTLHSALYTLHCTLIAPHFPARIWPKTAVLQ